MLLQNRDFLPLVQIVSCRHVTCNGFASDAPRGFKQIEAHEIPWTCNKEWRINPLKTLKGISERATPAESESRCQARQQLIYSSLKMNRTSDNFPMLLTSKATCLAILQSEHFSHLNLRSNGRFQSFHGVRMESPWNFPMSDLGSKKNNQEFRDILSISIRISKTQRQVLSFMKSHNISVVLASAFWQVDGTTRCGQIGVARCM